MAVDWTGYKLAPDFSGLAQGLAQYGANKRQSAQFEQELDLKNRTLAADTAYKQAVLAGGARDLAPTIKYSNNLYKGKDGSLYRPVSITNANTGQTSTEYLNETKGVMADPSIIEGLDLKLTTTGLAVGAQQVAQISAEEQAKQDAITRSLKEREDVLQKDQLDIIKKKNEISTQEMDLSLAESMKNLNAYKADDIIALADSLYNSDLTKIYGYGESKFPDEWRSEEGQLLLSQRNQLIGQINLLASKDRPKGEGSISDPERKTFAEAASILGNPNLPPKAVKSEIARIRGLINKSYGRVDKQEPTQGAPQAQPNESINWSDY